MTKDNVSALIEVGRRDGNQLLTVANAIYKVCIALIIIVAGVGLILSATAANKGEEILSFAIPVATVFICAAFYAATILGINSAKVLVHLLFSNLAILAKREDYGK